MSFWTRKAPESQIYCSHYLKDRNLMNELGVYDYKNIEFEIINGDFSRIIDSLGEYEDFMRENNLKDVRALRDRFFLLNTAFSRQTTEILLYKHIAAMLAHELNMTDEEFIELVKKAEAFSLYRKKGDSE